MAAQAVLWGALQAGNTSWVVKLHLWLNCYLTPRQKQNVLKPCLSTLLLGFCRQTDQPGKLQAQVQLLTHSTTKLDASPGEPWHTMLVFFFFLKPPQLSEDAWEMCKPPPWEESSAVITCHLPLSYVISALTGPSNFLLLCSRSLATPSLPSTAIPPARISAGKNLFYPSPLRADSLQFSQRSQQEKRRSRTRALKSTACLLAGDSTAALVTHTAAFPSLHTVPAAKIQQLRVHPPTSQNSSNSQSHLRQEER